MFRSKQPTFSISIPRETLETVFDECDRFNIDETGGRVIGTFRQKGNHYDIEVGGVIEPGPNAERTPTFFLQDGEHQEKVFRSIEKHHPNIEHLGNWHTHHVNGLQTLSGGDRTTYFATVNHHNHNTDFFYALLVVRKNSGHKPRYEVKHFFLRRKDDTIYEIPHAEVRITDTAALWPRRAGHPTSHADQSSPATQLRASNVERTKDQDFFADFYPHLKALLSKSIGAVYWKGQLELVDGSNVQVVAVEDTSNGVPSYSITASGSQAIADILVTYKERRFPSARRAVLGLERDLNKALYHGRKG